MVDITSLGVATYNIGAPQVIAKVHCLRNEHYMYTAARIKDVWKTDTSNPVMQKFLGTPDTTGNTLYLPYEDDKITSLRLPIPPPAGVDFFLTANMSGCRFFVDKIIGSNDLMVYHANTHQYASPPHSAVNYQDPQALSELAGLHSRARGDYAAAPHNLSLVNVADLTKTVYYGVGALAEQRKINQGRTLTEIDANQVKTTVPPEFYGGCSVMGFYTGGAWKFYYQTWGAMSYERPPAEVIKALLTAHWNYVHKARVEGKDRKRQPHKFFKVLESAKFYG